MTVHEPTELAQASSGQEVPLIYRAAKEYWNFMNLEWKACLSSSIWDQIFNWASWGLPRCLDGLLPFWILGRVHRATPDFG